MVKLLKLFLYSTFFLFALIYFFPKENLYYYGEHALKKQKVILSKEEVKDKGLSLELHHVKLYYDSIESADIENFTFTLLGLYNKISVNGIKLSSIASNFIPLKINTFEIKYTLLNPLNILFFANGEFGDARGAVSIVDRNMTLILQPSSLMLKKYKNSLRELHKNSSGEYKYVQSF